MVRIFKLIVLALSLLTVAATAAQAQVTVQGVPVEYGLSFQEPATPIMERAVSQFNVFILPLMAAVTVFVLALLLWTCWRFRERDGHQPGNFTHNTRIEIIWTVVPILILVVMFVPAMRFLYYNENGPDMLINGERGNDKHAELVMRGRAGRVVRRRANVAEGAEAATCPPLPPRGPGRPPSTRGRRGAAR